MFDIAPVLPSNDPEKIQPADAIDIATILPSNDPEKIQPTDPKVVRRATLKIDLYLIPIIGMFSVSTLSLDSPVIVMGSPVTPRLDLLAFLVSALLSQLWNFNNEQTSAG
jgi:hypothetical protein